MAANTTVRHQVSQLTVKRSEVKSNLDFRSSTFRQSHTPVPAAETCTYRLFVVCVYVRLTLAVLGVHGVSIVTGQTVLTAWSSGVEQAPQTLPREDVTVSRLTDVHVTVTITAHTGAADYLGVTMETTCAPADTDRHQSRCVCRRVEGFAATFHRCVRCILPGSGHMTPDPTPPAHRWD